jgi:DNA-binding HxlR family transcriptional regulator
MTDGEEAMAAESSKGCALDPVLSFLSLKWLLHIVWFLGRRQKLRFGELRHLLPGRVSAKVLSGRLKQLQSLGLIERENVGTNAQHVSYQLSQLGRAIDEFLVRVEFDARRLALPLESLTSSTKRGAKDDHI